MAAGDFNTGGWESSDGENAGFGGVLGALPGLNIIAPGILAGATAAEAARYRGLASDNAGKIQLPEFAKDPGLRYGYSGDFNPNMLATPEAAQYQTVSEDPRVRAQQMQALGRLQNYGDQAANSAESLGRYNAMSDANAMAAQRENAIKNQMQMRGQGGSGSEFAMQQIAAQEGANRAQAGTMNAAQQAALQRLQGTQAAFGAAGQLRGQDFAANSKNSDIINAFNMHNTDARNQVSAANTGLRNAGQLRNLDAYQGVMNNNTGLGKSMLDRSDNNTRFGFGAQMSKLGAVNDSLEKRAQGSGQANDRGQEAGKTGWSNFKDLASMMGGGMG